MSGLRTLLVVLMVGLVAACGGGDEAGSAPLPTAALTSTAPPLATVGPTATSAPAAVPVGGAGDAVVGEATWRTTCSGCHSNTSTVRVGPGHGGIATRAGMRTDLSAEEYIRQSIVNPAAYVVEGFPGPGDDGSMPEFGSGPSAIIPLSDADIDNLVAYLLTLE